MAAASGAWGSGGGRHTPWRIAMNSLSTNAAFYRGGDEIPPGTFH